MRTWSTLHEEQRPIRRLQRLRLVRKDGSHNAPSHRRVWAHRECEWKHSEGHRAVVLEHEGSRHVGLTNSAFSWKFVYLGCSCTPPIERQRYNQLDDLD